MPTEVHAAAQRTVPAEQRRLDSRTACMNYRFVTPSRRPSPCTLNVMLIRDESHHKAMSPSLTLEWQAGGMVTSGAVAFEEAGHPLATRSSVV